MKYELYANLIGLGFFVMGFIVSQPLLVIAGLGIAIVGIVYNLFKTLRGYFKAVFAREKPSEQFSLVTILATLAHTFAMLGLTTKFTFWAGNPQIMRAAVSFYVPVLVILLIQIRVTATVQTFQHYMNMLINALIVLAITFLFFLTPEKKLAQHFYTSQPEKLKNLLLEIEKRTPPKILKKKQ